MNKLCSSRRITIQTSLLALARFLGLSPGTPLEPAEKLEFRHIDAPDIEQALPAALAARDDYRSLISQQQSLTEQEKASHARYLPTLAVNGNYGAAGRNFGAMPATGGIEGILSVTIFDRDRNGEKQELESRADRLKAQTDDLARGIEQDLRKAILDIHSTEQQVSVTQAGLDLARRELSLGGGPIPQRSGRQHRGCDRSRFVGECAGRPDCGDCAECRRTGRSRARSRRHGEKLSNVSRPSRCQGAALTTRQGVKIP